ncbi:hypothetical protein BaRGS_00004653 [Batillaria attramentaria]|uniref:Uncharacterized protein n=1 Tax=Batillaria attramentaria TaxID=370345 RepID=A0ABD0LXH9_9CAEN
MGKTRSSQAYKRRLYLCTSLHLSITVPSRILTVIGWLCCDVISRRCLAHFSGRDRCHMATADRSFISVFIYMSAGWPCRLSSTVAAGAMIPSTEFLTSSQY